MKTTKVIWAIIIALTFSLILWGWRNGLFQKGKGDEPQQKELHPKSGVINITQNEWKGVQCLQNNMRITAYCLTPGVWWQVMFDYREDQVYDLYPMDWKTNSMFVATNSFKSQRWRIKPGDKTKHAVVAWEITPDK